MTLYYIYYIMILLQNLGFVVKDIFVLYSVKTVTANEYSCITLKIIHYLE